MNFVSEIIQLKHTSGNKDLTVADGVYAHAAVVSAISQEDAELGQALHDMKRHKSLTLAIVKSRRGYTTLRLAFMSDTGLKYATSLTQRLLSQPVLRIGSTICEIQSVDINESVWGRVNTWADLIGGVNHYLHFKFITPTAITQRSRNGQRFLNVLPEPSKVFSGLAKRWSNLSGPILPTDLIDFINDGGCVVSSCRLQTERFKTSERSQIGFTGTVIYECLDKTHDYVTALNALTRFAFFSGVGYQTTRGMGMVQTSLE